ncbi:NADH-quinone oxidoreductase subunit J [Ideonella sp. 4Y11]|uniref:NADH-quinone oxidoreductase subunit J n=1 Tax=Ideonella aquatica TaxID=2824119 RepID=A0A940YEE3_9BURK|nr:NADH-quinone oxidoreductase subunit J [Ideonella aquatica]MBN8487209.1 NADH-quinone oxidoreductase subunit J [Burkholderiales bacterium]MBQ0958683.1 NADH-quinone oxidoreductase subunit J [Ideonella aquatica]
MNATSALFYLFSAVLLVSAFLVITSRSTVHAALYLVLTFFNAACIWMLLKAEFLSITLVLVYVGAVMVLFLFVVMMLDINTDSLRAGFWSHFPLAALVGVLIAIEVALVMKAGFNLPEAKPMAPEVLAMGNTKALGVVLYTEYLYPLQVAAVLLLVGMIAAIALTLRKRKDAKGQDPSQQVRVRPADRVRLVKLAPTIEAPSVPKTPEGGQA